MKKKAILRNVEKDSVFFNVLHQGIKRENQYKYEQNQRFKGGNGTYAEHYYEGTHLDLTFEIPSDNATITLDVYNELREAAGWKKLTDKRMNIIESKIGDTIEIDYDKKTGNYSISDFMQLIE